MEELSIKENTKRYNEALEIAKRNYVTAQELCEGSTIDVECFKNTLEKIFPELKESEDEKIIKWIIDDIRYNMDNEPLNNSEYKKKAEKAIAWLEKQSEHKKTYDTCDSFMMDNKESPYSEKRDFGYFEEISADNANSVFHEGDWITIDKPCQIIQIINDNGNYMVRYCDDEKTYVISKNFCESHYHLWTIEDAKDGDVLVWDNGRYIILFKEIKDNIVAHCSYNTHSKHFGFHSDYDTQFDRIFNFSPATKEQREILFQKMKEAGYEQYGEKKELKSVEQKPYWSEEDIFKVQRICKYLNEAKKYYADITEVRECIDWLKSLEDKYTCKSNHEKIACIEKQGDKLQGKFVPEAAMEDKPDLRECFNTLYQTLHIMIEEYSKMEGFNPIVHKLKRIKEKIEYIDIDTFDTLT